MTPVDHVEGSRHSRNLPPPPPDSGWPEGWRNKLIWGDNKYVLSSLLDEFAGKVDLIYIDPPFATGADFTYSVQVGDTDVSKMPSVIEELAYRDTWGAQGERYYQYMFERLVLAHDLLSSEGSIYVHMDPGMGHYVRLLLDAVFGYENFRNEIVWAYSTPSGAKKNFPQKHDNVLFYAMPEQGPLNAIDILVPYSEKTLERSRYGGQGFAGKEGNRARNLDSSSGRMPYDWWVDIPMIMGNSSERTGYGTQKPKALLERIIKASSNPGDICLDFFGGSGTTAVAAEELGRRWISVDLGRFAIQTTRKRLLDIPDCRPFEVLNLGRYERAHWQGIDVGEAIYEYYAFILKLYGAQPISGFIHLHGERGGRFVHVGATDSPVTRDEVEQTLRECDSNGLRKIDILGWEWEMGLNPAGKDELAAEFNIDARLFNIPREVMDRRAVNAGDVHFFELSVADIKTTVDKNTVVVELSDFLPAVDDYMRQKVEGKITRWSDWIDYWSVDFDFDGEMFLNQWQAYRTRKNPALVLHSDPHIYEEPGEHRIVVKVIDIFGNDTTRELRVVIEPE